MNQPSLWRGVIPAITTPFAADGGVDHAFLARHANQLLDAGCTGIVPLGSLGEAATLSFDEKVAIMRTLVEAVGARGPVIPGIAALSTDEGVRLARAARAAGCAGLMVLPPYVYSTDWREMGAHVGAIVAATDLPCLLYNNPVAYKTDFSPEQIAQLAAEHPNVQAVKESSGDVRRFAALKSLLGRPAGTAGGHGRRHRGRPRDGRHRLDRRPGQRLPARVGAACSRWPAPAATPPPPTSTPGSCRCCRLDTVPKFVQLIKLVQQESRHRQRARARAAPRRWKAPSARPRCA
jgi:4-hydroxy-tetrahydrodipicolinate synthase